MFWNSLFNKAVVIYSFKIIKENGNNNATLMEGILKTKLIVKNNSAQLLLVIWWTKLTNESYILDQTDCKKKHSRSYQLTRDTVKNIVVI